VLFSSDGSSIYASGIFQGALSVASSADSVVRSLVDDVSTADTVSRGTLLELQRDLKLKGGSRIQGTDDSWIQSTVESSDGLLVSGGGKIVEWGSLSYADDFNNYFVGRTSKVARVPAWGIPISPIESAVSGNFTVEAFQMDTIAASPGLNGSLFVAGTFAQAVEIGWKTPKTMTPLSASSAFVGKLNSAGELACTFD